MSTLSEKYEPPPGEKSPRGDSPALDPLERIASQTYNYGAPGTMEPHAGVGLSLVESELGGHKPQHQYLWKRLAKPLPLPSPLRMKVMM